MVVVAAEVVLNIGSFAYDHQQQHHQHHHEVVNSIAMAKRNKATVAPVVTRLAPDSTVKLVKT